MVEKNEQQFETLQVLSIKLRVEFFSYYLKTRTRADQHKCLPPHLACDWGGGGLKQQQQGLKKFAHLFQHAYLLVRLGGEEAAVEGDQLQEMLHPHTHVVLKKLGQVLQ